MYAHAVAHAHAKCSGSVEKKTYTKLSALWLGQVRYLVLVMILYVECTVARSSAVPFTRFLSLFKVRSLSRTSLVSIWFCHACKHLVMHRNTGLTRREKNPRPTKNDS
jgi:hypothetical protein